MSFAWLQTTRVPDEFSGDVIFFSWEAPVTSLRWKIQAAASRPTPQTQNRGSSRVCLGLLGAFIPPAAAARRLFAQNMPPPRSLLLPQSSPAPRLHTGSNWPVALFPPPGLSSFSCFIFGLHPRYRRVLDRVGLSSASSSTDAAPTSTREDNEPSAGTCIKISPGSDHPHIPPALHLIPPPPPLRSSVWEEVFSWSHRQDHQGAPSAGWGDWRDWRHGEAWRHFHWCMSFTMWKVNSNMYNVVVKLGDWWW